MSRPQSARIAKASLQEKLADDGRLLGRAGGRDVRAPSRSVTRGSKIELMLD
jgi:hypothetical protein